MPFCDGGTVGCSVGAFLTPAVADIEQSINALRHGFLEQVNNQFHSPLCSIHRHPEDNPPGLIAALLGLRTPEDMAAHPCAMLFLETFALTSVMRSWSGAAAPHAFYYMKDSKGFSIDLLIETADAFHPVNVQKGFAPGPRDWKPFATLSRLPGLGKPVRTGAVIALTERPFAVGAEVVVQGPEWIWERGAAGSASTPAAEASSD